MKLFRRKSSAVTNVPPEVAEYYQAERRERKGVAWLMTLLALLVTVAIVLGLFLAGRWLYRTVRGNDASTPSTSQTQGSQNQSGSSQNSGQADDNRTDGTRNSQNSGSSNSGSTTDTERSDDADSGSTTDESSGAGSGSTGRETTTPPAADSDELANTGPGETVAILFAITVIAGYVARTYRLQRR